MDATAIPRTTAATMSPKSISQARLVTGPVVRLPALACIHICRSAPRLARCSNTAAARPVAHPYGTDKLPSARVREALLELAQRSSGGPACARCIAPGGNAYTRCGTLLVAGTMLALSASSPSPLTALQWIP